MNTITVTTFKAEATFGLEKGYSKELISLNELKTDLSKAQQNLFCIGDATQLEELFQQHGIASPFLHLVHAPEVIGYHEHPTKALKEKPNSSIAIGFRYLAEGKIKYKAHVTEGFENLPDGATIIPENTKKVVAKL